MNFDSNFSELQRAADLVMQSKNPQESMKHLAHAFSLFSKETHRLRSAYKNLQNRFKSVNIELEKANEALREKMHKLNIVTSYLDNILTNISEGIIFVDLDGIITTINPAAIKILQLPKDIAFKNFFHHLKDDYFGFSMRNALHLSMTQKISYITLPSLQKEIEVTAHFVHASPKEYRGILVMLRDVSEIQKLQKIASRSDRLKELGEMAATVAHEIRNPLGGIRGYASLLYRNLQNSKHLQDMAKNIVEGTKALERLVTNVLQFSKPIEPKPQQNDIVLLMKEMIKFLKVDPSFSDDLQIHFHCLEKQLFLLIDKDLIKSALLNILVNAFQAIEEKGKVMISIMKNNNLCMITISDNGKGIHAQDLDNIFSPFFTTKKDGNGLGLSETYKIIQAHLGTIDVRSEINRGTTFTIHLPIKH
jgi:signal transduction histidine kinase